MTRSSNKHPITAILIAMLLLLDVASAYNLCCFDAPPEGAAAEDGMPCHTGDGTAHNPLDTMDDCSLCVSAVPGSVADRNSEPAHVPRVPGVLVGRVSGGLDPPFRPPTTSSS